MNTSPNFLIRFYFFLTLFLGITGSAHGAAGEGITRSFLNNNVTGKVLALHPWGATKVVPAEGCAVLINTYKHDINPNFSSGGFKFSVENEYGMAFQTLELPYSMVPPAAPMPNNYRDKSVSSSDKANTKEIIIEKGTLRLTTVQRTYDGRTDTPAFDEVTTVSLRFNEDFSRVWDMTFAQKEYVLQDGERPESPAIDVETICEGEFDLN